MEFYSAAFGLSLRFLVPGGAYAELETGPNSTTLAFASYDQAKSNFPTSTPGGATGTPFYEFGVAEPPPPFEVGLVVADVPAAFARAVAAGATPWAPPTTKWVFHRF